MFVTKSVLCNYMSAQLGFLLQKSELLIYLKLGFNRKNPSCLIIEIDNSDFYCKKSELLIFSNKQFGFLLQKSELLIFSNKQFGFLRLKSELYISMIRQLGFLRLKSELFIRQINNSDFCIDLCMCEKILGCVIEVAQILIRNLQKFKWALQVRKRIASKIENCITK